MACRASRKLKETEIAGRQCGPCAKGRTRVQTGRNNESFFEQAELIQMQFKRPWSKEGGWVGNANTQPCPSIYFHTNGERVRLSSGSLNVREPILKVEKKR